MVRTLLLYLFITCVSYSGHCAELTSSVTPPLRIVTESFPPYSYKNNQGEIDGAVALVVKQLLKQMQLDTPIEILPWARAYNIALKSPNVLIFSLVRIPPREQHFHWLVPVTSINIGVYALPESEGAKLESLDNIEQLTIGVMRESSSINFFKSFRNVTNDNLIEMATFEQLYKMLMHKRVNFVLAPDLLVKYLNHKYQTPLTKQPIPIYQLPLQQRSTMYLAMSKSSTPSLVMQFKQAIAELQKTGQIMATVDGYKQSLVVQE